MSLFVLEFPSRLVEGICDRVIACSEHVKHYKEPGYVGVAGLEGTGCELCAALATKVDGCNGCGRVGVEVADDHRGSMFCARCLSHRVGYHEAGLSQNFSVMRNALNDMHHMRITLTHAQASATKHLEENRKLRIGLGRFISPDAIAEFLEGEPKP